MRETIPYRAVHFAPKHKAYISKHKAHGKGISIYRINKNHGMNKNQHNKPERIDKNQGPAGSVAIPGGPAARAYC